MGSLSAYAQVSVKTKDQRVRPYYVEQAERNVRPAETTFGQTRATYLTEDFESGTFPPTGWSKTSGPTSTVTDPLQEWHEQTIGGFPQNTDAFNGTVAGGCAAVRYVNSTDTHDEYLSTPDVALPNGPCRVSFDFATSVFWHAPSLGGTNDNADIQVLVSTDGGATWEPNPVWQEDSLQLLTSSYSDGYGDLDPYVWSRAYVDLSSYQGQTVTIGFYYNGLDGAPFYLDNLSVEDIPDNDIAVLKAWSGDIVDDYDYSMIPEPQIKPMRIGTVVRNLGGNAQTFDVTSNIGEGATSVFNGSQNISLQPGEIDTLWWDSGFTPSTYGVYDVSFSVPSDDEISNDSLSVGMELTDYFYAHDFTVDQSFGFDQDETVSIGAVFTMENNASLNYLEVKFETGTSPDLFSAINIWEIGQSIQDLTLIDQLNYNVPASSIGSGNFVSITFNAPIQLDAGKSYIAEVQKVDQSTERLYLGSSDAGNDDNATVCYGPFGQNQAVNWYSGWSFSPAIRMNFHPNEIVELNGLSSLDIYPNPSINETTVTFDLINAAETKIQVTDLTGRMVYEEELGNLQSGRSQVSLNTSNYKNGVYIVNVSVDGNVSTKRLTVQK